METARSTLQFQGYDVEKMLFQKLDNDREGENAQTSAPEVQHFDLAPRWRREVLDRDEKVFSILLGVIIEPSEDSPNLPVRIAVELRGYFQYTDDKMISNATAILFPYVRATLSMLMAAANETPIILPTMNIVKLFEEAKRQEAMEEPDTKLSDTPQS